MPDTVYTPPGPVGRAFMLSDAFVRIIMGPYGSGKSTCCCMDIIRRAREMPKCTDGVRRSRVAVIRNTSPQLNTTTIKTWHQWIPQHIGHWRSEGPACHRIIDGDMDLEVMFVALDRPQDVAKLLSLELTMAWINEVREISRTVFEGCTGRLRRFPSRALLPSGVQYFSGMICDTNPPDSDGWLYKLMEENKPENYAIFKQPSALSPDGENLANLDPRYYKDMMAGKTQEWINVYVHGQYGFIADGRPVFPEYSDVVHCKDVEPDKRLELYVGIDFGRTPCAVFGQKTKNGQWRILDELCTEDMGARDFAEELNRVITKNYDGFAIGGIYGDPAGDQRPQTEDTTPFQILRACGIHAKPAPTQDFTKRREAVAYYLSRMFEGEPGMVISPKCKMLRKGFNGGYCWQRVGVIGKEIFKDMPTKNEFSHVCLDGETMITTPSGEKKIKDFEIGDMVITPTGIKRVIACGTTGLAKTLLTIETKNGLTISCTPNHSFFSDRTCLLHADAIHYNDVLQSIKEEKVWKNLCSLGLMEKRIGYRDATTGGTIGVLAGQAICTGQYGKAFMALSQKGATFITKTATRLIMQLKTWIALMKKNTCMIMLANHGDLRCQKETLKLRENMQGNGIKAMRQKNFTIGLRQYHGNAEKHLPLNAAFAEKSSARKSLKEQSFAVLHVKQGIVFTAEKMMKSALALFVEAILRLTNIRRSERVVKIVKENYCHCPKEVYNLTIEDDHCFYANGILVGNCDSTQYMLMGAGEGRMLIKRKPIRVENNFYDAPLANEAIMDYNPYKTEV